MGEQAQFIATLKTVGEQMTGLSTTVGAQGVAKIIKSFDGNPKEFKEWITSIEKYCILTRVGADQVKMVAYQSSKGPVSNFLKRHLETNQAQSWNDIKAEMTKRFAEVTDTQYALSLLRKVKQKPGESIQVYAERLMVLSEDAFEDQTAANQQLVGFFIDGLLNDYMKMKVMRENPTTLQAAITTATEEQNLRRRFDLRSTGHLHGAQGFGAEPMEVGHARPSFRCYKCNKRGHKAKECRSRQANVNSVANSSNTDRTSARANVICWFCQKRGHYAYECRAKAAPRKIDSRPSQVTSTSQGN